ncbi:hypothetical protein [Oceanirhabdus seepicola]|uniref:Uncharacterized protein n=1 Tax=Oceanirhabdus seepicola TaxID=2828781 RepID=A0A9J6P1I9_9CLOT|nr:hypothetical protein [Oceanirhabdus seepicola]MCM1989360.1 hypothetical protein [Oceanirhabdus seepicola]
MMYKYTRVQLNKQGTVHRFRRGQLDKRCISFNEPSPIEINASKVLEKRREKQWNVR